MQDGTRLNYIRTKVIAILCVFVMTFCFLPMNVFAMSIRQQIQENNLQEEMQEEEQLFEQEEEIAVDDYKNKRILREETEKRKTNEKHYILEDGTKLVTMYPANIHYKENGKLVDVDNSLEAIKDKKETLKLTAEQLKIEAEQEKATSILQQDETILHQSNEIAVKQKRQMLENSEKTKETKIYENKANSYKTKFTNKTKGYYLGSLTSEGNTITWRLKNANSSNINVKNPSKNTLIKSDTTIEDIQINQIASEIEYQDILDDTKINYVLVPEMVKENIILDNPKAIHNKLVFEYETNGMEMKLLDNNDIVVYKENEKDVKFTDKIKLNLKKQKEGYELTIEPDKEWLQAKGRQYPVTIDPTIQTSLYYENISDTYIYEGDTNNTTRYQAHILRVGNGAGKPARSLIKFTLPTLQSGDQIIAAELSICNYPDTNEWDPPTQERFVNVHKITSNWASNTVNWSNMSSKFDSKVVDYAKYKYDPNNTKKDNRFDITSIVKDWYTSGNNYGVMLKEPTERTQESGTDMYFLSADTSSTYTNYRPKVIMAYRNQTGLEDYLSYHSQSAGRAGEIYTNDYNGNLTLMHTDVSTPGNRLPVTVKHVYNTNEKDVDIGYGKGMRLNLSQTLEQTTISSQEYLKYTDEDATVHYLLKNTTKNIYEDEDGLGLIVKISGNDRILTDKSGNIITFTKYASGNKWHLKEIKDTENNKITLTLTTSGSNYLISQVQDAVGDKIQLAYSSGKLQKISDTAGRNITYTYDNSARLTNVTYPDSKKSVYTYGSKNELTKVQNIDGSYLTYSYYPGSVYRVKTINEYGTGGTQGKSLTITYGNNLTTFKDNKGYSNTYTFDNWGHAVSIADFGKNDQNINNAYGKTYIYGTNGNTNNKLTLESKMISVKDIKNNLVKNPSFDSGLSQWGKNGNCDANDKVVSLNGNNVAKIIGNSSKNKYILQEISTSGKKGDIYTFAGWIKSLGISKESGNLKSARYTICFYKTDGTKQYIDIPVTSGTDSWQFISRQLVPNGDYNKIGIFLIFYGNCNEIYFDNIGLYKEEFGQSYQYDNNGNLITSQDLAKQNSTFQYSGNNELLQNINPKGGKFVYEYDYNRKGRLLKAVDSVDTKYSFNYDAYGNTTSIKVEEGNKTDEVENGKSYFIKLAYSGKYFDLRGLSKEDNGILQQYTIAIANGNQQFKFEAIPNEENYYKILPQHVENKALYYDETDTEQIVKQKTYQNTDNFKWKLIKNDNGSYCIENKAKPNYVISIKNNEITSGKPLEIRERDGSLNQNVYLYNVSKKDKLADKDFLESGEVYYIKSKTTGLYLEQESDELYSMINQGKFKEKDPKQLWRVIREYNNVYKLIPLGTKDGYALYPKGEENIQDQRIGIKTYSGKTSQKWIFSKTDNSTYSISTMLEGNAKRYLRTLDNSKNEGVRVVLNTSADQYYLEKANMLENIEEGATYTIKAQVSKLLVGVNGTNVEQQEAGNSDTQKWILHKEGNGYYSFRLAADTTKTLDLAGGATANGTNIQVKQANGSDTEKFEIVPTGSGTYMLKPKNGKGSTCVDIAGGKTTVGINVQNYATNHTASQYFYFTKVASPNTNKYIESKASYNSNGNYTIKTEDQLGGQVKYTYNESKGILNKVEDAKGNQISYSYDNLDRLTNVSTTTNGKTYQNQYAYENDRLKAITHNGFSYSLIYDAFGNQKQVKIGNSTLITNEYEARNGNLLSSLYGNNHKITYAYDRFDRITKKTGTSGNYNYSYDGRSNLESIVDEVNNNKATYTYDLANRVVKEENTNGYAAQYEYDKNSNVSKITDKLNQDAKVTQYNYDLNNHINNIRLYNNTLFINNYDRLLRTVNKQIKTENGNTYQTELSYTDIANSNKTSTQINCMKNGQDNALNYTYDKNGNIETISEADVLKHKYYYDSLNQLTRENDKGRNMTITYEYDQGGNILSKTIYPYTTEETLPEKIEKITYQYENTEWKDQLTSYNNKKITYDTIGNPLTYDGNTYTWQNGRQLASIENANNNLNITYKYNDNGIRTEKTVNGVTTKYYLNGSKVIYEKTGDNISYYTYDESGNVLGIKYNDNQYYYKKNLQGDIIGLLDSNLEEVVQYSYDSWGNTLSIADGQGEPITDETHIGHINPYRYRGYRYDKETGLYYLQSRYYSAQWGRFINFDNYGGQVGDLLSHNGYAYCLNNPVNMVDEDGNFAIAASAGAGLWGLLGRSSRNIYEFCKKGNNGIKGSL